MVHLLEKLLTGDVNELARFQLLKSQCGLAPQPFETGFPTSHQPQRLPNDFAGTIVKPGCDFFPNHPIQGGSECDLHDEWNIAPGGGMSIRRLG